MKIEKIKFDRNRDYAPMRNRGEFFVLFKTVILKLTLVRVVF